MRSYYTILLSASSIVKRDIYLWKREETSISLELETESRPCWCLTKPHIPVSDHHPQNILLIQCYPSDKDTG